MEKYQIFLIEKLEQLDKFTRAIAKVHGGNHPELHEVREVFLQMKEAIDKNPTVDVRAYLEKIDRLSSHYKLPSDACQTYAATYAWLEEATKLVK